MERIKWREYKYTRVGKNLPVIWLWVTFGRPLLSVNIVRGGKNLPVQWSGVLQNGEHKKHTWVG